MRPIYGIIGTDGVNRINWSVIQCPEDIVLSSGHSELIGQLVRQYSGWRMDATYTEFTPPGEEVMWQGATVHGETNISLRRDAQGENMAMMGVPWWGILLRSMKWVWSVAPHWIVRRRWPERRILSRIELLVSDDPAGFFIAPVHADPALEFVTIRVCNFTPLPLRIVGYKIAAKIDSQQLLRQEQRLAEQLIVPALANARLDLRGSLDDTRAARVRNYADSHVRLQLTGVVVMESPIGEHRVPLETSVVARIDRGPGKQDIATESAVWRARRWRVAQGRMWEPCRQCA